MAKAKEEYMNMALTQLCPNPWNPRQRFSGDRFDQLVESIREKGVLEPILVRPFPDGEKLVAEKTWPNEGRLVSHEIVAGERRFRAMYRVASENGGPENGKIPVIVKELSDDEAFEIMTIENIQRDDLTELEEARNFQMYLDRKGADAAEELASRTGIQPTYIRRRVRVLSLPKTVLTKWDNGHLKYGHLEQLCRLKGVGEVKSWCKRIEEGWQGPMSVRELKRRIDNESPQLTGAFFDLEKEGCVSCTHNSDVQKQLFAVDQSEKTVCSNPKCFKKKQNNYLLGNWKKAPLRRKYKTNGFIFDDAFSYQKHSAFYAAKEVFSQCKTCEHFVTVTYVDGSACHERTCLDPACKQKLEKARSKRKSANSKRSASGSKGDDQTGGDQPRVAWHGEHFRELFYQKAIRKRSESLSWDDPKVLRMLLFGILCHASCDIGEWFARRHGLTDHKGQTAEEAGYFILDTGATIDHIIGMEAEAVDADIAAISTELVLASEVTSGHRRRIGDLLEIDLAKEWRINSDYLQKKTIGEMLAFGEKLGIFADPAAIAYLEQLGRKTFKQCKKPELVKVFLESGVNLAGKVPDEILADDDCGEK